MTIEQIRQFYHWLLGEINAEFVGAVIKMYHDDLQGATK